MPRPFFGTRIASQCRTDPAARLPRPRYYAHILLAVVAGGAAASRNAHMLICLIAGWRVAAARWLSHTPSLASLATCHRATPIATLQAGRLARPCYAHILLAGAGGADAFANARA